MSRINLNYARTGNLIIKPENARSLRTVLRAVLLAGLVLPLAGCSSMMGGLGSLTKMDMFKAKEEILPGKRLAVLKPTSLNATAPVDTRTPVIIPATSSNMNWTQPGGTRNNAPGNLQYRGSGNTLWYKSAGYGTSARGRITALPIVYNNTIYTLDTRASVSAFSTGGNLNWRKSLVPANEGAQEGFGGGLAVANGAIIVATGFGEVYALDPRSGKTLWKTSVGAPVRSSPTASGGKIFVVSTEGKLFCLSGHDGSEIWTQRGSIGRTRLIDNASPAIEGQYVVVPYTSGDVVAYNMETGGVVTSETLSRTRRNSSIAAISNPARPVISGGVMYAVSHAGRMVATSIKSGHRLWTLNIRSQNMPWVVGNMVYVVDLKGKLHAITRKTGKLKWVRQLPAEGGSWYGPVMAGGKLWLTSSGGTLAGVDARTGAVTTRKNYGQKTNLGPVVAAGKLFVLTDTANLVAFN